MGAFPAGNTPEGIADLDGNVWEWTSSQYCKSYARTECESYRVLRGGGWDDSFFAYFRAANRGRDVPTRRANSIGFRCVRS